MLPTHFSPSSLGLFDRCPQAFYQHYIQGVREPTNLDLAFGKAVHAGLEGHYRTDDAEISFLSACHMQRVELKEAGLDWPPNVQRVGLDLLAKALRLGLTGEPEKRIRLSLPDLPPIIGIVDLWDSTNHRLVDWKTSRVSWAPSRAEKERWQSCLYTLAYQHEHQVDPTFSFVVLPRDGSKVQVFDATRSARQIGVAMQRLWQIVEELEHDRFDCIPSCGKHRGLWSPGFDEAEAA